MGASDEVRARLGKLRAPPRPSCVAVPPLMSPAPSSFIFSTPPALAACPRNLALNSSVACLQSAECSGSQIPLDESARMALGKACVAQALLLPRPRTRWALEYVTHLSRTQFSLSEVVW